jgi:DNA-binding LacI/PurR family transcriptional regulator
MTTRSRSTGKTTSFDIAHLAGVSQPTVSRALRDSPMVHPETRRRIQAIAKELQYQVDKNASNLRFQHSNTLALLFFEDPTPDDSQINPFFLAMLGSITRASAKRGYDLLISFQKQTGDWHHEFEDSRKADGIILLGYGDYHEYRARLEQLVAQGTKFVLWSQVGKGIPGVSVGCDNEQGARDSTNHLLALGRRHIAFLGYADSRYPEFEARHAGYQEALKQAGIQPDPYLQVDAITTEQSGRSATLALLARTRQIDAIVAASDMIALGAIRALQENGLRVPHDVAVVGFDDIAAASLSSPPLTTVVQDSRAAGEVLVDTLLQQIRGELVQDQVLPARLVVRRSCGSPQAG